MAPGRYRESLTLDKGVTIRGKCIAMVAIRQPQPSTGEVVWQRTVMIRGAQFKLTWKSHFQEPLSAFRAIRAVHGLLCANYWADKRTHAYMGYAGPPAWALQVRMAGGADDG